MSNEVLENIKSRRSVRYMHSAFHFFVLAGSGCHLVAVWYILAGI